MLRRPRPDEVDTIAAWHPVPGDEVRGWWEPDYVDSWVMVDDGRLIAYGELWLDEEEDEVELARLIVDPAVRGQGHGKRLTQELMAKAADADLTTTMLRTTIHLLMVGSLALIIALVLFTVAALNYPFRGDITIYPEAMEHVLGRFQSSRLSDL